MADRSVIETDRRSDRAAELGARIARIAVRAQDPGADVFDARVRLARRQVAGASPTSFLNARLKAASDS